MAVLRCHLVSFSGLCQLNSQVGVDVDVEFLLLRIHLCMKKAPHAISKDSHADPSNES